MISMTYHPPSSYFPPSSSFPEPPPLAAVYNGVNPNYPGLRMIHGTPPIYCVDQFLTAMECNFLIDAASDSFTPAPVVGKGSGEISASRTSSTCYLAREDVPDLMRKVSALTGKPIGHCELPQVGRYLTSQHYVQVSFGNCCLFLSGQRLFCWYIGRIWRTFQWSLLFIFLCFLLHP